MFYIGDIFIDQITGKIKMNIDSPPYINEFISEVVFMESHFSKHQRDFVVISD